MNRGTVIIMLMLILGLAALSSIAELQGVTVNGAYDVKDKDRVVHIIRTFNHDNPDPSVPAIRIRFEEDRLASWGGDWIEEVAIPAHEARRDFPDQVKTFLSFYARTSAPAVRGDLVVFVGEYPAYSGQMTGGGWQPLLVDLSSWNGKSVQVRIHLRCLRIQTLLCLQYPGW